MFWRDADKVTRSISLYIIEKERKKEKNCSVKTHSHRRGPSRTSSICLMLPQNNRIIFERSQRFATAKKKRRYNFTWWEDKLMDIIIYTFNTFHACVLDETTRRPARESSCERSSRFLGMIYSEDVYLFAWSDIWKNKWESMTIRSKLRRAFNQW